MDTFHKAFEGIVERGKCSIRWFFVFKFHLIINDKREVQNMFTPENVNDRKSLNQVGFLENIEGRLCANKGYIGQGGRICIQFLIKVKK